MGTDVQQRIHEQVTTHPVVLYMKGSPKLPQCGFSANAIRILSTLGVNELFTVDVLQDAEIRQGIKGLRQLADHSAALYQGRIYRWLGHHDRNAPERRA